MAPLGNFVLSSAATSSDAIAKLHTRWSEVQRQLDVIDATMDWIASVKDDEKSFVNKHRYATMSLLDGRDIEQTILKAKISPRTDELHLQNRNGIRRKATMPPDGEGVGLVFSVIDRTGNPEVHTLDTRIDQGTWDRAMSSVLTTSNARKIRGNSETLIFYHRFIDEPLVAERQRLSDMLEGYKDEFVRILESARRGSHPPPCNADLGTLIPHLLGGAVPRGFIVEGTHEPAWCSDCFALTDGNERFPQARFEGSSGYRVSQACLKMLHGEAGPDPKRWHHLDDSQVRTLSEVIDAIERKNTTTFDIIRFDLGGREIPPEFATPLWFGIRF